MSATEQLTIATEQPADRETVQPASLYETAEAIDGPLDLELDRRPARFVRGVLRELGNDFGDHPSPEEAARLVEPESLRGDDDADDAALLAFPDESLVFVGRDPTAPESIVEPPEANDWLYRRRFNEDAVELPDGVPEWADFQAIAGDVLVRGTLRHRENDHYVENVGEQWHEAITHDVYTGDGVGMRVD